MIIYTASVLQFIDREMRNNKVIKQGRDYFESDHITSISERERDILL